MTVAMQMQSTRSMWLILVVLFVNVGATFTSETTYQSAVKFKYFNERNESNIFQPNTQCNSGENTKLAVIVHGWMESCETVWVKTLMHNLNTYRHGCIVCMDYSIFSMNSNYYALVRDFNGIANVLTKKLKDFQALSFVPNNIYMFGFSFGAQLVLEAGRRFGKKLIKQIDVCDPAGPGFDNNILHSRNSPRNSAQNVQCIHTSANKGTRKRDCHQNWNMGNCGNTQAAAGPRPLGSHGLCPYFYTTAFQHRFLAIPKPSNCRSNRIAPGNIIGNFSMGYMDALKYEGRFTEGHDFFANTFKTPPYNIESDGSNIIESEDENLDYY
ncbi:pancreatic triacylglycerol lipase-like [Bradysia coprophila]|uniref:pancreatic triacylglycerol lipase-like n=1 Tax=Bradysia coprophila TaxID=38358 RepID=UPI00187D6FA9|nr:pancreatic triacylglycerol lipase-like [Bradysia coprophila]